MCQLRQIWVHLKTGFPVTVRCIKPIFISVTAILLFLFPPLRDFCNFLSFISPEEIAESHRIVGAAAAAARIQFGRCQVEKVVQKGQNISAQLFSLFRRQNERGGHVM